MGLMAAPPCARCLPSGDVLSGVCAPATVAGDEGADNCGPENNSDPFTSAEPNGSMHSGSFCDPCPGSLISSSKEQLIYVCGLSLKTCDIR